jgi:hypothetical protein
VPQPNLLCAEAGSQSFCGVQQVSTPLAMAEFVMPPFAELEACVLDNTRPSAARTRGIFYLRTIGTEEAAAVMHRGTCCVLQCESPSFLPYPPDLPHSAA